MPKNKPVEEDDEPERVVALVQYARILFPDPHDMIATLGALADSGAAILHLDPSRLASARARQKDSLNFRAAEAFAASLGFRAPTSIS